MTNGEGRGGEPQRRAGAAALPPDPPAAEPFDPTAAEPADPTAAVSASKRPLIERLGLAAIAVVLAILFGGVSVASWLGGELFLAVMAGIGALMTAWAGAITLTRG